MDLTPAQVAYLAAVALYLLFFLLFLRFFLWKRYAERTYWRRRPRLSMDSLRRLAHGAGRPMPFISVLVPARNEAEVIARTVEHIGRLRYPADRYELIVVTDDKEWRAAEAARSIAVAEVAAFLRARAAGATASFPGARGEALLLALIAEATLEGWDEVGREYGVRSADGALRSADASLRSPLKLPSAPLWGLPACERRRLVRETAALLLAGRGRAPVRRVVTLLRRTLPAATEVEVGASYPALLALAIPAAYALSHLRGRTDSAALRRMAAQAARARAAITAELIHSFSEALATEALRRLDAVAVSPALERELAALDVEVHPTTQHIVESLRAQWRRLAGRPALKHAIVPHDFDGRLHGGRRGASVPSTKGRALNWGLGFVCEDAEWCGFYDAESRPDPDVLLYVAYRSLRSGDRPRILQGPVFQVRNFYEMGPFCKIASLYQSIAHDWYLPALFRRLPFVGGTNLFVDRELLEKIGGYDDRSLTEDLELGTRAYLQARVWPEYLPYPSSEQTPPTFLGFYRQRLRWGTGHLQVMEKLSSASGYPARERRALLRELFRKGQLEWVFYQAATFVPPTVLLLWWNGLIDPSVLGEPARWSLNLLSSIYLGFTIYAFFRYARHVDATSRPQGVLGQVAVVGQLFLLPLAAFLFPVPYSSALVLRAVGR